MAAANTDPIQKPPGPFFSPEAILRLPQGKHKGHYIRERREGTGAVRMAESRAARIRPAAHNLEAYLTAYIEGTGLVYDPKGSLFRTLGRETKQLTRTLRRAANAGIATKISNHSFRAGITASLKNGGTLEKPHRWPIMPARGRRSSMSSMRSSV
jgi:hypothetical protein